jgi:hypothetical protein
MKYRDKIKRLKEEVSPEQLKKSGYKSYGELRKDLKEFNEKMEGK